MVVAGVILLIAAGIIVVGIYILASILASIILGEMFDDD